MTALPDQAHRDAISGAEPSALAETVFVDAGAGTGKTTALVARVVNLLRAGVPVREIAAITFTEAAAAELRHRVRGAVGDALADAAPGSDEERRLVAALGDLDDAAFTTLHAFAYRILLDHPLQAGLPPELALLTDIEAAAAFESRWDAWLSEFVSRPGIRPVLEHLDLMGISIQKVHRLAKALHEDYHRIPAGLATEPATYEPPPLDLTELVAELDALAPLADEAADSDPADKLVARIREWHAAAAPLRAAVATGAPLADQLDALDALHGLQIGNVGGKRAWGSSERAKEVRGRLMRVRDELVGEVYAAQFDHLLRALLAYTSCFVLDWAAARRRSAELVFQDLLVLARDLLRDDAEVRSRVRGQFRHLLVDEFQDTDPIQIEIAVLLAAQDDAALAASARADGSVAWQDATLVPGRLFFVGDPKQSIYRFRGADIGVYEGAKSFVDGTPTASVRSLSHSFRSVPGVLDWVNAAFEALLEERDGAQPAYQPLTGERAPIAQHEGPAVRWFGGEGGRAEDVREAEAADVVRVVRHLLAEATVHDRETDRPRPAREDDIAVLVRRHATARQLERTFEDADLPLVVESRSLIFNTDEVRDLTTILTAIEDPNDEVAVLGALRHPAFGCSDADLVDWRARGGRWWFPRTDTDPDDHPVARALHRLGLLREARWGHSVGGFVEHVIDETRLMELALVHRRHRDRWRRIRFVADQAHAFHEAGGHLRGFVRWLRDQADEEVRRDEHVVPDADDRAVRVTTVHAAKGLEYPIVIVLGLDTATRKPLFDPVVIFEPDGSAVEVNLGREAKTLGFADLNDEERRLHFEEEQRLLYVATTRARDHLVISRHHGQQNRECHARTLAEHEDLLAPHWSELDLAGIPITVEPESVALDFAAPRDTRAELEAFTAERDRLVRGATRPRGVAATTIASLLADPAGEVDPPEEVDGDLDAGDDVTDEPVTHQPWRKGRAGTAIGRAVHAVLQNVDLASQDGLDELAAAQCAAEGLPDADAATVAAMARRACESDIVIQALASGRYWRELHVGAPVALADGTEITIEGFVDLLVETDEGLVVADYKTDSTTGRTPEETVARYRPQAATYALALETALGREVTRCVFVLTGVAASDGREVEVSGDDLRAAIADLRSGLALAVA